MVGKEGELKMNRMLIRDQEFFDRNFHEARSFLRAAHLRYELACLLLGLWEPDNVWNQKRIQELLHAPACREPWFMVQLRRGDAQSNEVEDLLLEAGL